MIRTWEGLNQTVHDFHQLVMTVVESKEHMKDLRGVVIGNDASEDDKLKMKDAT